VYFFSSAKKIAKDSICEDAKELISPHFKGTNWQEADSYFDKTKRYFTNSRIYVVSASPMIVAVVPWKYKTHPKDPFYWHKISEEIHDFHMGTKETKAPQFCWIVGSKNMIELRSTFPAEPTSAQIISGESKIQINLPAKPGEFADIKIEEIDYSMEKTVTGEIRFRKKQ
jgi:hypothetical protein